MSKPKKAIKVEHFRVDGYPFTLTFTPTDTGMQYQIMNEMNYKVIKKGTV